MNILTCTLYIHVYNYYNVLCFSVDSTVQKVEDDFDDFLKSVKARQTSVTTKRKQRESAIK